MAPREKFTTIDEYIATFPESTQEVLEKIRKTIAKALPDGTETISYNIPCFKQNGTYVIYFAGYAKHVSVYPLHMLEGSLSEINKYMAGKSTAKFPLSEEIPYDLISQAAKHLLEKSRERAKKK